MTGSSAQQPIQTTTQQKEPWGPLQPDLLAMYDQAGNYRTDNIGYQPYTGQTVANVTPNMQSAMDQLGGLYSNQAQSPQLGAPVDLMNSILGGSGLTSWQGDLLGTISDIAGHPMDQAGNAYRSVIDQQGMTPEQRAALGSMSGLAGDTGDLNAYRQQMNLANQSTNPYLQQIMDAMNRQIGDRVNSSMSGAGRYGSGAHTDVMSRALAESEAPIMSQDYEARQNRALQAAQGFGNALTQHGGLYGNIAGQYGQGLERLMSGAQGLASNLGQKASMYGNVFQGMGSGLERQMQAAGALPGMYAAEGQPAQNLMGLGEYQRSLDQQNIDAAIKLYNAQQAYPWEQLAREAGILQGGGALGGTTVGSVSQPAPTTLQRILGGGLVGGGLGSAFGPIGTGAGALGGGLLGLLR